MLYLCYDELHLEVVRCDDGDIGGFDPGSHEAGHVTTHQGSLTLVTYSYTFM